MLSVTSLKLHKDHVQNEGRWLQWKKQLHFFVIADGKMAAL